MRAAPLALACSLAALPAVTQSAVDPARALAAGAAAEKSGSYAEALRQYTLGAEAGDPACMNALGDLHYDGHGVPQSFPQALAWYRKAAAKGLRDAQHNLGFCHANGQGVSKDMAEAVRWYRLAADQGFAKSQANLATALIEGSGVAKDPVEGRRWLEKAAQQGLVRAQRLLGYHHWSRTFGARDAEKAYTWFKQAADQEDPFAMDFLAYLLSRANEVPRSVPYDPKAAYRLYLKAALKGFVDSQLMMGDLCREGRMSTREGLTTLEGLLKEDLPQARDWYAKAAAQGSGAGYLWLGHLATIYKVPADGGAEALRAYPAAIQAGDLRGFHNLTMLYDQGGLVPRDPAKALEWALKGARMGDADSWEDLETRLFERKEPEVLASFETLAQEGHAKAAFTLGLINHVAGSLPEMKTRGTYLRVVGLVEALGLRGDRDRAYALFIQAAKGGDRRAYEWAADAYAYGWGGVKADAQEAERWKSKR